MGAVWPAIAGALGTIISAWIAVRLQKVQRTVNGHTQRLERRIADLESWKADALDSGRLERTFVSSDP